MYYFPQNNKIIIQINIFYYIEFQFSQFAQFRLNIKIQIFFNFKYLYLRNRLQKIL